MSFLAAISAFAGIGQIGVAGAQIGMAGRAADIQRADARTQAAERREDVLIRARLLEKSARARAGRAGVAFSGSLQDLVARGEQNALETLVRIDRGLANRMAGIDVQEGAAVGSAVGSILGSVGGLAGLAEEQGWLDFHLGDFFGTTGLRTVTTVPE